LEKIKIFLYFIFICNKILQDYIITNKEMKILEVKKIEKTLAKKRVLHGINFSVNAGEIYGFL